MDPIDTVSDFLRELGSAPASSALRINGPDNEELRPTKLLRTGDGTIWIITEEVEPLR